MEIKPAGTEVERLMATKPADTEIERKTRMHKALHHTCHSTTKLSSHLPTGVVLVFRLLSPLLTSQGNCSSLALILTAVLISLCGISCFILAFTDSFRDNKGNICYGFATLHGFWIIDGSAKISPELAAKYKLQVTDFVRASLSVLTFMAVAFDDQNLVDLFFPESSSTTHAILKAAPLGISAICGALFVVLPSQRHEIGVPLSVNQCITST